MSADTVREGFVVLVVDGDPIDAPLLMRRLEQLGHETRVHHATSVGSACGTLLRTPVDLVVLSDEVEAEPMEAFYRVRAVDPNVPVVLIGDADDALAMEALGAGAQDYLTRPTPEGSTLERIVRYACARQRCARDRTTVTRSFEAAASIRWQLLSDVNAAIARAVSSADVLRDVVALVIPATARSMTILWDPLESTCRHASLSIL